MKPVRLPTAPLAAASLIAGYAVAAGSGSRPLGGAVLLGGGLVCGVLWKRRHGMRSAAKLAGVMFAAFAGSHVLALAVGAWEAVLLVSAMTAAVVWVYSDAPRLRSAA